MLNNVEGVNRQDNFMRDIEKDKKRSNELLVENVLKKVHSKTLNVYGLAYWPECGAICRI